MNRIKLYRIVRGMSWDELLHRSGIGNRRLWKIQRGWETPTEDEAQRLAKAFDLPTVASLRFTEDNLEIPQEEIEALLEL